MKLKLSLISAATAAGMVISATPAALADGDYGGGGGSPATVIAGGLDNPRGLTIRYDTLYIAQAGKGGDGACIGSPESGTQCLGDSGKISALDVGHDGAAVVDIVTGLPSLGEQGTGNSASGPSDVETDGIGVIWATIGLGGLTSQVRAALGNSDLANLLGTEGKVRDGQYVVKGDPAAFEEAENPDGSVDPFTGEPLPDSNPNSLVTTGKSSVMVADAGGNSLVNIHGDGSAKAVATFPTKPAVTIPNSADPSSTITITPEAVPDSVALAPDGTFYIGELTGFPFLPGTAAVWSWRPGHDPEVFAEGFTNIIDIAVTDDGGLLVLEIAANGLTDPGGPVGALFKVGADGTQTQVDTGPLFAPGGLAVSGNDVYISNNSILAGAGEIVRVRLDG